MSLIETIDDFYEMPDNMHFLNKGESETIRQFNVFRRWSRCSSVKAYLRRDFYRIVLTENAGILSYSDRRVQVDGPAIFVANKVVPYSWEHIDEKQEGWVCIFSDDFFDISSPNNIKGKDCFPVLHSQSVPIFNLDTKNFRKISNLFDEMDEEYRSDYPHRYNVLQNYLHLMLHQIQKIEEINFDDKLSLDAAHRTTFYFLELLEQQFPTVSRDYPLLLKTPFDFSQKLNVHVNHLNSSVKKVTSKTSSQLIADRVIIEAKKMLQNKDWTIAEVSFALGFEYPSYFTNFFRKHEGISPRESRNNK